MTVLYRDGEPCEHRGCERHITHPCEWCGRIAASGDVKDETVWNTRPDQWIKFTVDDKTYTNPIPSDEDEVLVTDGKEVWLDTFINDGIDGCYFDSGYEIVPDATCWQPLPEPPEGDK